MNHFDRPDYNTEKFGRMFTERFFMDAEFRDSGCIVLENVCETYIQREGIEMIKKDRHSVEETDSGKEEELQEAALSVEDEPQDTDFFIEDELDDMDFPLEDELECFELVIIRENRVLAAVSVAEISPSWGYGKPLYGEYQRRESFNRMVKAKFGGMGFMEIEKKSCGWTAKPKVESSFEQMLFDDEMPLKEELCRIETDDYYRVREIVLENLHCEKPPEYLIHFRNPGQDVFSDEKAQRRLMREGLIRRNSSDSIHITAPGRSDGLISAYRRGKSGVEQVVMAVDNGKQDLDLIRRWELGGQSPEEEMEIFGWKDQRQC